MYTYYILYNHVIVYVYNYYYSDSINNSKNYSFQLHKRIKHILKIMICTYRECLYKYLVKMSSLYECFVVLITTKKK